MNCIKGRVLILFWLFIPIYTWGGTKPFLPEENAIQEQKNSNISGIVVDKLGDPLPGANVVVKGTTLGVTTDIDGGFSLSVPQHSILHISFIGFIPVEIAVKNQLYIRAEMQEGDMLLDDVIVTALGLKRNESELAYSINQLKGEELTKVKDANLMNSLSGKVAGMQINKTSSGLGASSRVVLRGIRSVIGNNQPLYVIDGIPILNSSNEQAYTALGGATDAGNRDGGDGISNLNPEDIASISVLKGSPAAALYGSQAANGVILITTKTGQSNQRTITFSTNLTFDQAISLPKFQNSYGVSDGIYSWGAKKKLPQYNNLDDFFRTGYLVINSLSISTGNDNFQTYFSYANTTGKGITDHNSMNKHNVNFRETATLFNDRLKLDGNVNLFRQQVENRTPVGGFYMNPLVGLYRFPRGEDISEYKNNFEVFDATRNLNVQNWHSDIQDFEQNPYWVLNRISSKDVRNRIIASFAAEWHVTDWLKIKARGSVDNTTDNVRQQFYASTAPALCGENGRYIESSYDEIMFYGDLMGVVNKRFRDFTFNGAFGTSIHDKTVNSLRYDSKNASLHYANVFTIANIIMSGSAAYINQQIDARRQMQSLFATAQLGYKEMLFLDVTARNDWTSTLAFTPNEKIGFFYPSFGGSWIINKSMSLPQWISFSKIRAVWSKVGNDIPLFITNPVAHIKAGGEVESIDAAPFENMKPEMTSSVELGTEWKFLDNRISLNITWYQTNTRNQFFKLPAETGDKYAFRYVNAGDIQNRGWEINITGYPIMENKLSWRTEVNFSTNRNKVLKLHEKLADFLYGPRGFSSSYAMKLREGGSFGDIYGKAFLRDENGIIQYETEGNLAGLPQVGKAEGVEDLVWVGNCNPKFNLSWGNTLTYKEFDLSFLIDCRVGGKILSQTFADMDLFGVTEATEKARDLGYVELEGRKIENVEGFYKNVVGGRAGTTEYYMYDATNIRLRELAVSYSLPKKIMKKSHILKKVQFSVVGRNLFFIYKKAPFDPELVLSTMSDNQGIDVYGIPTTRSLGFNIKCEF